MFKEKWKKWHETDLMISHMNCFCDMISLSEFHIIKLIRVFEVQIKYHPESRFINYFTVDSCHSALSGSPKRRTARRGFGQRDRSAVKF